MSQRRHLNERFASQAKESSAGNVMASAQSNSLAVVLRRARATGHLQLTDRRLRELPIEAYAPTPDDLEDDEKFWEIVELRSMDISMNLRARGALFRAKERTNERRKGARL